MDDEGASTGEIGQFVEQCEAALLKVLLHLDFVRLALKRTKLNRQPEAIRSEFAADAGQENFHQRTPARFSLRGLTA